MPNAAENGRGPLASLPVPRERTPEQQARYELINERSRLMQERGVKPKDGVTFGASKRPKRK